MKRESMTFILTGALRLASIYTIVTWTIGSLLALLMTFMLFSAKDAPIGLFMEPWWWPLKVGSYTDIMTALQPLMFTDVIAKLATFIIFSGMQGLLQGIVFWLLASLVRLYSFRDMQQGSLIAKRIAFCAAAMFLSETLSLFFYNSVGPQLQNVFSSFTYKFPEFSTSVLKQSFANMIDVHATDLIFPDIRGANALILSLFMAIVYRTLSDATRIEKENSELRQEISLTV
jgi:hypothetical protein